MKNFNKFLEIDETNSQLERAEIQKRRLIRDIYREYELYLSLLRELLYICVEKGLNELCSYESIKDHFINANDFFYPIEKKIKKLIYRYLPLLTVEQLKINEIEEKKINNENNFNNLGNFKKTRDGQKGKFQNEEKFQFEEPIQFQINEDIAFTSKYYQTENNEKYVSLDLDNNDLNNYLSNNNIIENIGLEKQFISSLLELIEVVNVEKPIDTKKENVNLLDNSPKYNGIKIFDLIDKSLENLLLKFSYKINQELFNANLIKKMISKDSFDYLVGKKIMIKHPNPFVINFEFNLNHSPSKDDNISSIFFFYISTAELEFKNLNLSIQRNKINELKNKFQHLIKKEMYWRQKQITFNKIS